MKYLFQRRDSGMQINSALFIFAAAGLLGYSGSIQAQDVAAGDTIIEEVIVTGSRIVRSGTATPTPVTFVDARRIEETGELSLGDILREVPALTAGVDSQSVTGLTFTPETVGVNLANLRGLGTTRTLVLVNGRRHVGSSPGNSAVDLNAIPTGLIERVDVITGGASAVYGADAVTGVINVVLKDRFEGVEIDAQYGASEFGDAIQTSFGLTFGANTEDGRGNVYAALAYHEEEGIRRIDRPELNFPLLGFRPNPANTGPNDGTPDNVITENVFFFGTGSCTGYFGCAALPIDPATGQSAASNALFTFNRDGGITHITGEADPGGSSELIRLQNPDPFPQDVGFQHTRIPLERYLLNTGASFELTDQHTLFFEGAFARAEAKQDLSATFDSGTARGIRINVADNPYLGDTLRNTLLNSPTPVDTFLLTRRNTDHGQRGNPADRNLIRTVIGLEGELAEYSYEVYYQYGQSSLSSTRNNDRIESRYRLSVDAVTDPATGLPACRAAVDAVAGGTINSVSEHGCVPINLFGERSQAEIADALGYFQFDAQANGRLTQNVVGAQITGDLFILGEEPIGIAAGIEYRKEQSEFTPSPLNQNGDGFFGVILPRVAGEFDVFEAYGEFLLPLVRDVPGIQELNLEGAVRWADYSTAGNATSWKVSGDWIPFDSLRLRGSFAQSVRAPNIAELFAPSIDTFTFVTHPCDADNISQGTNPANRAANCAAADYAADFQAAGVTPTTRVSGSTSLETEEAETFSVGAVFTPSFMPGLAMTIDYWDIGLTRGISNLPGNTITAFCFDSSDLNNPFCDAIDFFPDGNFNIIRSPQLNIGRIDASGVDFEANYGFSPDALGIPGDISINTVITYLGTLESQLDPTAPIDENEGEVGRPEWRGNFRVSYNLDNFSLSWNQRYLGKTIANNSFTPEFRSPRHIPDTWYTNVQGRYRLGDRTDFFGGINNVLDNDPPRIPGISRGDSGAASIFSNIGRYYYAGLKIVL